MDSFDSHGAGGSLQISTEVIEKIAQHAVLEVEGVCKVVPVSSAPKFLLDKITQPKAIKVALKDDVADIEISILVAYGTKIPELSEKAQKNVKDAVQNMTSISVARVDIIVAGIDADEDMDQ